MSRDGSCGGTPLAIVGPAGEVRGPEEDEDTSINNTTSNTSSVSVPTTPVHQETLPEGWEDRRTSNGRIYYVNHVTKTTQWTKPTLPASQSNKTSTSSPQQNGNVKDSSQLNTPISSPALAPGPSRSATCTNINGTAIINGTDGSTRRHSAEPVINSNKENKSREDLRTNING